MTATVRMSRGVVAGIVAVLVVLGVVGVAVLLSKSAQQEHAAVCSAQHLHAEYPDVADPTPFDPTCP